jgi:hypothetical protein
MANDMERPPGPLFRLTQACKVAPYLKGAGRGGKDINHSTLIRFALHGKVVNGERVRLQTLRVGSALCTTERWLLEFFRKLSAGDTATANIPMPTTSPHDDACAVLGAAGIA